MFAKRNEAEFEEIPNSGSFESRSFQNGQEKNTKVSGRALFYVLAIYFISTFAWIAAPMIWDDKVYITETLMESEKCGKGEKMLSITDLLQVEDKYIDIDNIRPFAELPICVIVPSM